MASRIKEDERNERTIRNLLKLPENRRCINCNSLGAQYVCTNFSTFICTTCSGIHREFTHRVKSVSMAKFTTQEVSALQGGGNASARVIYLKEWDPQRNSLPDGSNVERLRDFIKHVYVDRRYTGEKNLEKPLREKMEESNDFNGNKRADSYQGGSRSPPYGSPGYGQEIPRNSDDKRSPARPEVVNDWRREDRFGNGRLSDDRSSDGGSKFGGRSPDIQRDSDMSSPPIVRPVREILGDSVSPLRIIEPPKVTIRGKATDLSTHTQRTVSSSILASSEGNSFEVKVEASLIDFDDSVPEVPVTATVPQTQVAGSTVAAQLAAPRGDNWANFDSVPQVKVTTAASNSLESLLEMSIPASTSSVNTLPFQPIGSSGPSSGSSFRPAPPSANTMGGWLANAPTGGQWASMRPQQVPGFSGNSGQPVTQPVILANSQSSSNMPWNQIVAPNAHGPFGVSVGPAMDNSFGHATESSLNTKSGERKELPADLFAMNYSYHAPPVSGWYPGAPYRPGVPMQYNMPMAAPQFQPVSRSTNPFDVSNEPSSVQAATFPTMTSLQGALPGVITQSHAPPVPSQAPSYASSIPPSPYPGQAFAGSMAPRPHGPSGFTHEEEPVFTSLYPNHQPGGPHHAHSAPSNFTSMGGNPFG